MRRIDGDIHELSEVLYFAKLLEDHLTVLRIITTPKLFNYFVRYKPYILSNLYKFYVTRQYLDKYRYILNAH